jgi:hypothetical protein
LAGDLCSICVQKWVRGAWWCDHLMKNGFPPWQTNFKFAVSLIALRAMQAAPLARCESSALSFKFSLCAVPVATLCVFVAFSFHVR